MRIQDSGDRHLHFSLVLLSRPQGLFSFFQEKITIIFASKLPDLDKEISQMILESRNVLVKIEQPCNCDLDLIICQMRKCILEKIRHKSLYVRHVIHVVRRLLRRIERRRDLVRLDETEHVGEDGGVHGEARRVAGVGHHAEHVLNNKKLKLFVKREYIRKIFEKFQKSNGKLIMRIININKIVPSNIFKNPKI